MFTVSSVFTEFEEVFELLKKKDFPSQIKFSDPKTNITIEILIFVPSSDEINFKIKCYANNKPINTINLNKSSITFFQNEYRQYIKQATPIRINSAKNIKKKLNLFLEIWSFIKASGNIIKRFEIQPILFYPFTLLNIYSIDEYNNSIISRTAMRSFDKINIINTSYIDQVKGFLEIHKLNVVLVDIIVQNRIKLILKMTTIGTKFLIRLIRIYFSMIWILANIILFLNENSQISSVFDLSTKIFELLGSQDSIIWLIIINLIFSIIWRLLPTIIRKIITTRLQKGNKIIQMNKFFSKFNQFKLPH